MKSVGIIVVFYNLSDYVTSCLTAIAEQSHADFTCYCIDDCSTDDTFAKLTAFSEKDPRFVAIQNERNYGSPCHSRNVGLEKIQPCDYFMILDGDDLLHPEALKVSLSVIESSDTLDCVAFDKVLFSDENHIQPVAIPSPLPVTVYHDGFVRFLDKDAHSPQANVWNKLYRTERYRHERFCEEIFYEDDVLYTLQILANTRDYAFIDLPLYFYRRHPSSVTSSLKHQRYLNDATRRLQYTHDYFFKAPRISQAMVARLKQQMAEDAYRMLVSKIIRKTKEPELKAMLFPIAQANFTRLITEQMIDLQDLSFIKRIVAKLFLNNHIKSAWLLAKIFG